MSYRVKRGAFAVGIVDSGQDTDTQTMTKLSLDSIRTSIGQFHSTTLFIKAGLAFSDTYFYDTGGGAPNLVPNGSHSPASTGGFGFDSTDGYSVFYGAGAVGCAKYTNNELAIYYYERNDDNHSIDSSICVVF
mgnify:CR=1 FL=1